MITFAAVVASAAVFYYGVGVRLHVGAGVLIVDAILLGSLVPLKFKRGLTPRGIDLRAAPAVRSVGFVILALIAYILIAALWVVAVRPTNAANSLADVEHQSTINVALAVFALA